MRRLFRITGSRKAPVHHQDGSFFTCGKISGLEEHVLEDEQHGQHVHQRADLLFLGLAGDDVDDGPGNDADGDALRDTVSSGHGQNGEEGGDALAGAGILFLLATIFSPLFLTIPSFATAPALIIVGFYMMGSAVKIDFNDPSEGIPAFLTILAMPTAYSISEGIAIGVISWTLINLVTGKAKEKKISPLMYVLTVLFILKYVFL